MAFLPSLAGHPADLAAHSVVAAASSAPADWGWGALASIVFIALIAIPAAVLNNRERRQRRP
jgi:ABC-type spermidine/putrescine transport system permease subunit I